MSNKEKEINIERAATFVNNSETGDIEAYSCEGARKLSTDNWEDDYALSQNTGDIFEVRFKNTRKGYFQNVNNLPLKQGDIVAVESSPGHDIGIISLSGDMVRKQMRCKGFNPVDSEFRKIYRIAKGGDIVKWQEAIALEFPTMIKARRYAQSLSLNMKIGDVEFQGDKIKAIFYYIADARVDFRELIRVFADEFKIRIEMKQIGARQEAGCIGGIGSCGRELCCSTWMTNFVSVTTNSARFQEISLNPQKLAGQCGKLKCCLNYEVDSYIDSRKGFPKLYAALETADATYHLVKSDILKREMIFSSDPHSLVNLISIPVSRVKDIIIMNKKGIRVDKLREFEEVIVDVKLDYMNVVGDDSITRFDKSELKHKPNRNKNRNKKSQSRSTDEPKVEVNGEQPKKENNRPPRNKESRPPKEQKAVKEQSESKEPKTPKVPREPRTPREPRFKKDNKSTENVVAVDNAIPKEEEQPKDGNPRVKQRPPRRWNNRRGGNGGGTGGAKVVK